MRPTEADMQAGMPGQVRGHLPPSPTDHLCADCHPGVGTWEGAHGYTEWTPVGTTGWTIRRTGPRSAQAGNRYGWNDNAIRYDDGSIAYDYPERVPLYVRRAVARLLAED